MMTKQQRFALITGCGAGGIGEALANEYVAQGIRPITTVLPWEPREHLTSIGIPCFELDVTKNDSVEALRQNVSELTGGKLSVLVNNAGICYTMTGIDTNVREVQRMFDVNVFGPMRMVNKFHEMLVQAGGTIVNIGSVGGIVPYVYGSSYNASKAALHHWGNTLRVEMEPLGVKVLNIISGEIGTNILKSDVNAQRELPENSYFTPLAAEFRAHIQRTPNTTPRAVYAKSVVKQSLRASPPAWHWTGNTTWLVRFFDMFGTRRIWDYMFWNMFKFSKLKAEMSKKRKLGLLNRKSI